MCVLFTNANLNHSLKDQCYFFYFQEASRIRDDAKKTKDRAVDLLDSADALASDVDDSEDQVNNLDVQADSDGDLAENVSFNKHLSYISKKTF